MRRIHPGLKKKKFRLDSNDFCFIWAGVSNMVSYKTKVWYNLSCLSQIYYCLSTNKKLLVSWQFSGTYGVTKYSSGWRKDVIKLTSLEFGVRRELQRKGNNPISRNVHHLVRLFGLPPINCAPEHYIMLWNLQSKLTANQSHQAKAAGGKNTQIND